MTQSVCVASVPAGHPYVARTLAHEDIVILPDPLPAGAPAGQWWPPVVLGGDWIATHPDTADLLHIHFGTESFEPAEVARAVEAAHAAGWPVVQTVHDLVHPQLTDQEPYLRQLDVVLPLVDAVVTLTPGAASEIERRWGRTARVLRHPRLLADDVDAPRGRKHEGVVIGMHLKDLRPNVDGPRAVRDLLAAIAELHSRGVDARGEVRLHTRVRDVAARDEVRRLIEEAGQSQGAGSRPAPVDLIEHERLDDSGLALALAGLDACVLPYRSGTHSGWLELCWDLGVPVAAPAVGFFAEQHVDPTIGTFTPGTVTLADCLSAILAVGTPAGSDARATLSADRLARRAVDDRATTEAHVDLYRALLAAPARRETVDAR